MYKKIIALILSALSISSCAYAQKDVPDIIIESGTFYEVMGLSDTENVTKAVIVFEDGRSSELSDEEKSELVTLHWDSYVTPFTQPNTADGEPYINFYTDDGGFTVYSYGEKIRIGSFGENNGM